ncbi:MAG: type II secretion system F family protein [Myxococcota bacterium]
MPDLDLPQLTALFALLLVAGAFELARRAARSERINRRLFADEEHAVEARQDTHATARDSTLTRWLVRAGHRSPRAEAAFLAASGGAIVVAMLIVWGVRVSGAPDALAQIFGGLPVVGPGLSGLAYASPWFVGAYVAALPTLLVRRDRERRVEAIEQDLPLVLELLATLAEAGLGFESAVDELLRAQPTGRPLADELRLYQLEVSTGARRADSLRHLARRVDLASVSSFTSALAHGEEIGSSIAGLLRPQASLVRQRRRERALATAEALPEKLVVPLLIGFLPGLLVWTLGPAFFQLFEMIDAAF